MSTYVMSDIHGHYTAFQDMLKKINFDTKKDHLYIIGDIIDRGDEALKMIYFVKNHPSITMLMGNHEDMMIQAFKTGEYEDIQCWYSNGGYYTKQQLEFLSEPEISSILYWMSKLPVEITIDVNGGKFYLVHASPNAIDYEGKIWGRINPYTNSDKKDCISIVGHTPVLTFDKSKAVPDRDVHITTNVENNIYFIDCGAGYSMYPNVKLACLRLDDLEEFYVPVNKSEDV